MHRAPPDGAAPYMVDIAMTEPEPSFEERKWKQEFEAAERRWIYELQKDDARREHDKNRDFHTDVNKNAVDASNLTLRTLVVINGGAAIAVLTFLGGVAAKDKVDFAHVGRVAHTIIWFAFGVALAVTSLALAYCTHYATAATSSSYAMNWEHPYLSDGPKTRRWRWIKRGIHLASATTALASMVLFLIGMFTASTAITDMLVK